MSNATISKDVWNCANDPFVVKKTGAAKTFLDKHGFPKKLSSKNSNNLM